MCFEDIKKLICSSKSNIISPPKYLEDIDGNEIRTILQAEFPNTPLYISDTMFQTTTKEELIRFLKEDIVDKNKYISEKYDCDDFSYQLMGNISSPKWGMLPFGILWSETPNGGHAINCFIDNNREVWIIEPQSDKIFKIPDNWNPWLVVL